MQVETIYDWDGYTTCRAEYAPSGEYLAATRTWENNTQVLIFDSETYEVSSNFMIELPIGEYFQNIVWSPDSAQLALVTTEQLLLWKPESNVLNFTYGFQKEYCETDSMDCVYHSVLFHPSGKYLIIKEFGQTVIWDIDEKRVIETLHGGLNVGRWTLSPDGNLLVTTTDEATKVYDIGAFVSEE